VSHRRMQYLNTNRIIYRREPVNDKPTESFEWGDFYKDGTYEYYSLFFSDAKINTIKSLLWHLYVLLYLNPNLNEKEFNKLVKYITHKSNNFITFTLSNEKIESIIKDTSKFDLDRAPKNKLRKIIFKDYSLLTKHEKLKIVGQMIGREKLSLEKIYEAMLEINSNNFKITIKNIALHFKCSTRTVHRNINSQLRKEIKILNEKIQC
jgi:hypothetical protein